MFLLKCFWSEDDEDVEKDAQPLIEEGTSAGLDGISAPPTTQTTDRKPDRAIDEFQPVTYNYRYAQKSIETLSNSVISLYVLACIVYYTLDECKHIFCFKNCMVCVTRIVTSMAHPPWLQFFDSSKTVIFSCSFFHVVFAFASMYVAMLMTGWGTKEDAYLMDVSWTSMWVKMGSQFVTTALYTWTLVAPLVFPDRDF